VHNTYKVFRKLIHKKNKLKMNPLLNCFLRSDFQCGNEIILKILCNFIHLCRYNIVVNKTKRDHPSHLHKSSN